MNNIIAVCPRQTDTRPSCTTPSVYDTTAVARDPWCKRICAYGFRFPEWMQGQWTDVDVDATAVRYARVGGGGGGDAETTEVSEYKVRSSRSVGPSGSARRRRSAQAEPGVNGNVLGMALGRILFPEWYRKANATRRLKKRSVLSTAIDPFSNICVAGLLCVNTHPRPGEPFPEPTTTERTTTMDYRKERDYAMDPAERYDRYNNPFFNASRELEFQDRRKRSPDHEKYVENFQWRCAMSLGDRFLVFGGQK